MRWFSGLLIVAMLGSLLTGTVAILLNCNPDTVDRECAKISSTPNYFYAFRMPHDMGGIEKDRKALHYKIGFSKSYQFFNDRYKSEYRYLVSKCLLKVNAELIKGGANVPQLSLDSHKSDFETMIDSDRGFDRLIDGCVREHMVFHGAIQCYHTQACMDMKFICAVEAWNAVANNPKLERVPLSYLTVGNINFYFNKVLPTVPFLGAGSTETYASTVQPYEIPRILSELFTNTNPGPALTCDAVGFHDGFKFEVTPYEPSNVDATTLKNAYDGQERFRNNAFERVKKRLAPFSPPSVSSTSIASTSLSPSSSTTTSMPGSPTSPQLSKVPQSSRYGYSGQFPPKDEKHTGSGPDYDQGLLNRDSSGRSSNLGSPESPPRLDSLPHGLPPISPELKPIQRSAQLPGNADSTTSGPIGSTPRTLPSRSNQASSSSATPQVTGHVDQKTTTSTPSRFRRYPARSRAPVQEKATENPEKSKKFVEITAKEASHVEEESVDWQDLPTTQTIRMNRDTRSLVPIDV